MARRSNRLNVECLEGRELMAGDIAATVTNGILFLNEARFQSAQPNLVQITQLPNGLVRVAGLADAGDRTLVNGKLFQDFGVSNVGPSTLLATLGAGNDILQIVGVNRFQDINVNMSFGIENDTDTLHISGTRTRGGVRVNTGNGIDTVFIQNTRVGDGVGFTNEDLVLDTGAGGDTVNLAGGVRTTANATILTREGNDTVLVRGTTVGDGKGFTTEDLLIDTAAGADSVHFGAGGESVLVRGNLHVTTAFGAEADVDTVQILQTTALKSLTLLTGAGNDRVALGLVASSGNISVSTEDGNDTVRLFEVATSRQVFIGMGNGDDNLDLTSARAQVLNADGGAGTDRLSTFLLSPTQATNFVNWEVIDAL